MPTWLQRFIIYLFIAYGSTIITYLFNTQAAFPRPELCLPLRHINTMIYPIHPNELVIVGVACRLVSKIDLTISSLYACGVNIFPQKVVEVHQLLC